MRTAVALGSNLGDRLSHLSAAKKAIVDLASVRPPVLSSAVYETDPVGCEWGAQKFLNAVLEFEYAGDPLELLRNLRQIENALGRPADHPRNAQRVQLTKQAYMIAGCNTDIITARGNGLLAQMMSLVLLGTAATGALVFLYFRFSVLAEEPRATAVAALSTGLTLLIAFLFAADAGVFVAASAGNSGPASSTVAHPSPWLTTVAAGTAYANTAKSDFLVARYTASGQLDATFGNRGIVRTDFDGRSDSLRAMTLYPGRKILAVGERPAENLRGVLVWHRMNH